MLSPELGRPAYGHILDCIVFLQINNEQSAHLLDRQPEQPGDVPQRREDESWRVDGLGAEAQEVHVRHQILSRGSCV